MAIKRPLPDDWHPNFEDYNFALALWQRDEAKSQIELFRCCAQAHGIEATDWNAAFVGWCMKCRSDVEAQEQAEFCCSPRSER